MTYNPTEDLVDKLVERRKAAGLSQSDVASLVGVVQSRISVIESNKHSMLLDTMEDYAEAVGYTIVTVLVPRDMETDNGQRLLVRRFEQAVDILGRQGVDPKSALAAVDAVTRINECLLGVIEELGGQGELEVSA